MKDIADIRMSSGLQYKEIQAGESSESPAKDASVTLEYRGHLIDGTEFDSSCTRWKPSTFKVSKVINGWREAIQLMKAGAKREHYIPPELAYDKLGRGKTIPPNGVLIYEVELISFE
jgi:FKBP-type peptidyl-prolyl cis-trans isomerase FklB